MTKILTVFLAVLISVEFLGGSASANQNVFARQDDTVSSGDNRDATQSPAVHTNLRVASGMDIDLGAREGRGMGGDVLYDVQSGSDISFQPSQVTLSVEFVKKMNEILPNCVAKAANAAGYSGTVSHIKIENMGGYNNRRMRNGRKMSMHSTGRALDISGFEVTIGGQKLDVPMTAASYRGGGKKKAFYTTFAKCWSEGVKNRCGNEGVIDCHSGSRSLNRLHHDHLHVLLPFCPRKAGIATK